MREQPNSTAAADAAAVAPPPALSLWSESFDGMTQSFEEEEEGGGTLRDGASPGPARVPAPEHRAYLEDTTFGEDTDGEVGDRPVETPRWSGKRRRSWSGRRGDAENAPAAGKARGLLLLLLAGEVGAPPPPPPTPSQRPAASYRAAPPPPPPAPSRRPVASDRAAHASEDEDDGGRSRQSTPAGREYRAKRRRSSSADADVPEPVPVPVPAHVPVGTDSEQPKRRDGFTFARLGKSGRGLHSSTFRLT